MNLKNVEPPSNQGKTNEWFTPSWILDACGDFDLDPCGDTRRQTAKTIYTKEINGLQKNWFGRVWMNPPYGREVSQWTKKLVEHGNGLALIFARTDTKWFQEFAPHCSWILFLAGRVRFVDSLTLKISNNTPGAPSILCAVGEQEKPNLKGIFMEP
jgi:phage N-6-adenine-methyltransferase